MNIFDNYFPAISDIPTDYVEAVRARIVEYAQPAWPDLDMRPGSVFGDAHVTPLAYLLAAVEIAADRIRSDVTVENVANGIVYDCEFVKAFLRNFGVGPRDTQPAIGILRLIFNTDAAVTIPRNATFSIGTDVFTVYAAMPGAIEILPVGSVIPPGSNSYSLVDENGTYGVNVAVTGVMTTQVSAGAAASVSPAVSGLVSAVALSDFLQGDQEQSVSELARRSRRTVYGTSNGTPGGLAKLVRNEFPGITAVSSVCSGDAEMSRDAINVLGMSDGRLDVIVRSAMFDTVTTVSVMLQELEEDIFMAKLPLPGIVRQISAIRDDSGTTVHGTAYTVFSKSSDGTRATMANAAYSNLEELYLIVRMPYSSAGSPLLNTQYVTGVRYMGVSVDMLYDPMLQPVGALLTARENKPLGVDVLVKAPVPIVFDRFNINYARRAGVSFNAELARQEVARYIANVGYPDGFSEARLHDCVFLAGAHDVTSVEAVGQVAWSAADYFLPASFDMDGATYAEIVAAGRQAPTVTFPSLRSLRQGYTDAFVGTDDQTYACVGVRNSTFVLDDEQLSFTEVYEV